MNNRIRILLCCCPLILGSCSLFTIDKTTVMDSSTPTVNKTPIFDENFFATFLNGEISAFDGKNVFDYQKIVSKEEQLKASNNFEFYNIAKFDDTNVLGIFALFDLEKLHFVTIDVTSFDYSIISSFDFADFFLNYSDFNDGVSSIYFERLNAKKINQICFISACVSTSYSFSAKTGYVFDITTNEIIFKGDIEPFVRRNVSLGKHHFEDNILVCSNGVRSKKIYESFPLMFCYRYGDDLIGNIATDYDLFFNSIICDKDKVYIGAYDYNYFPCFRNYIFEYDPDEDICMLIGRSWSKSTPVGFFCLSQDI